MVRFDLVGIVLALAAIGLVWYLNKEQEEDLKNILIMIVLIALVVGMVVDI